MTGRVPSGMEVSNKPAMTGAFVGGGGVGVGGVGGVGVGGVGVGGVGGVGVGGVGVGDGAGRSSSLGAVGSTWP